MAEKQSKDVLKDGLAAVSLVARKSSRRSLAAWIYVPTGVVLVLLICFGVNALISLGTISFPASVACMILLFFALIGCELVLGDKRTRAIVRLLDIPCGFALRYISIFFTPSFVLIPLSQPISGVEVAKIIGVFAIGFLIMFAFTAYLVRGLQKVFGRSKRAITERAEEMGNENDEIPLTERNNPPPDTLSVFETETASISQAEDRNQPVFEEIAPPAPVFRHDPTLARVPSGHPLRTMSSHGERPPPPIQDPVPLNRSQRWATFLNAHLDTITYALLFTFIGLPIYYSTGYAMPAQLTLNILAYFAALSLPIAYKRFLHPVLTSSLLTVLSIWLLALSRHQSLRSGLEAYSTKTRYINLWDGDKGLRDPGAGDIFASILDVSIVALALPMFNYRQELKRHLPTILLPLIPLTLTSLLIYPPLCSSLSLSPAHSLSFPSRSLTLALALPTTANLKGSSSLTALLCIASGILAALTGNKLLAYLRIPEDDYVTRGVTMGANGSAIATAMLLGSDPRAASLSGLVMGLFGAVLVSVTAVPAVGSFVMGLAGG